MRQYLLIYSLRHSVNFYFIDEIITGVTIFDLKKTYIYIYINKLLYLVDTWNQIIRVTDIDQF
jgi:hypothetical protein